MFEKFTSLFDKAKANNPGLTKEQFDQKRKEAQSRADVSGKAQEGMMSVGGMTMKVDAETAQEIAQDAE